MHDTYLAYLINTSANLTTSSRLHTYYAKIILETYLHTRTGSNKFTVFVKSPQTLQPQTIQNIITNGINM